MATKEVDFEFMNAAENGNFDKLKSLANSWFNAPDIKGHTGSIALREASKNGHGEIVSFLLDKDVDCNSGLIFTELEHNNYDNIKKILDKGVNINYTKSDILHKAILNNNIEYAKLLINHGGRC